MMQETPQEQVYTYELIQYEGYTPPRKFRIYRLTPSEAHELNQGYALNRIPKRFVKIK